MNVVAGNGVHHSRVCYFTCLLALVTTLLVPSSAALANAQSGTDEDSAGRLDISAWSHGHGPDGVLRHVVRFAEPWDPTILTGESPDRGSVAIGFRVQAGSRYLPRAIDIRLNEDGSFYAPIYGNEGIRGFANVWRPDEQTLYVDVARRSLKDRRLRHYLWRASTTFRSQAGTGDGCETFATSDHPCEDTFRYQGHRL